MTVGVLISGRERPATLIGGMVMLGVQDTPTNLRARGFVRGDQPRRNIHQLHVSLPRHPHQHPEGV